MLKKSHRQYFDLVLLYRKIKKKVCKSCLIYSSTRSGGTWWGSSAIGRNTTRWGWAVIVGPANRGWRTRTSRWRRIYPVGTWSRRWISWWIDITISSTKTPRIIIIISVRIIIISSRRGRFKWIFSIIIYYEPRIYIISKVLGPIHFRCSGIKVRSNIWIRICFRITILFRFSLVLL